MKAYKGFRKTGLFGKGMKCLDMKYKVGKTYVYDGTVMVCNSGFHACKHLYQVWNFYPNDGDNVFCEVECNGDISESAYSDGKFACSKITPVRRIDTNGMVKFLGVTAFRPENGYIIVQDMKEGCRMIDLEGKDILGFNFHGSIPIDVKIARPPYRLNGKVVQKNDCVIISRLFGDDGRLYNIATKDGLLLKEWLRDIVVHDDVIECKDVSGRYNLLGKDMKYMYDRWFDDLYMRWFGEFIVVERDGKFNVLRDDGLEILGNYYDEVILVRNGVLVKNGNKWGFCGFDGSMKSECAYDDITIINKDVYAVKLDGKTNLKTKDGKFVSDEWFDKYKVVKGGQIRIHLGDKTRMVSPSGYTIGEWKEKIQNPVSKRKSKKMKKNKKR